MADENSDKTSPLETVGVTGLKRQGGRVYEEWLPELQGERGRRVTRQMIDSDPIVGAFLLAVDLLTRNVPWSVQPASNEKNDLEAGQFLGECKDDMSSSWRDTTSEIMTFVPWGWQWSELVYKVRGGDSEDPRRRSKFDDNRIGWRKISTRAQETLYEWEFDDDGGVKAMTQMAPPDFETRTIPIEKSLLFKVRSRKANPEPPGILRSVYGDWYFVTNIDRIEAIGIERDATGIPVVWIPPAMMKDDAPAPVKVQYASYQKMATGIKTDEQHGIVMPLAYDKDGNKLYDITLLATPGTKAIDPDKSIQRHKHAMAMAMLTDFMLLGTKTTGSYALSQDKTTLFNVALGTFLDIIEDVFNAHAVPRLFALNTFQVKQLPKLKHGKVESVDIEQFAKTVLSLSQSGAIMFPDVDVENHIRDQVKFPRIADDLVKQRRQEESARGEGGMEGDE